MRNRLKSWYFLLLLLALAVSITGCTSGIAKFDQEAYERATSLKVDSLAVMDKAETSFADNKEAVETLSSDLNKAYEYAKGRPKNEIITKQWKIMVSPDRHMIGGFLKRWEDKGKLSPFFIGEAKGTIGDGFDAIIGLESGLIKESDL